MGGVQQKPPSQAHFFRAIRLKLHPAVLPRQTHQHLSWQSHYFVGDTIQPCSRPNPGQVANTTLSKKLPSRSSRKRAQFQISTTNRRIHPPLSLAKVRQSVTVINENSTFALPPLRRL